MVGTTDAQTLTNKTLTSPAISSPTITGVGQVLYAYKTANETVSSATLLQDDDHLFVAIPAAGTYIITIHLIMDAAAASNAFKVALDFSGTVTDIRFSCDAMASGGQTYNNHTVTRDVVVSNGTSLDMYADTANTGGSILGSLEAGALAL